MNYRSCVEGISLIRSGCVGLVMFNEINFWFFVFPNACCVFIHSKNSWVVSTQIWVRYGETPMLG